MFVGVSVSDRIRGGVGDRTRGGVGCSVSVGGVGDFTGVVGGMSRSEG